MIMADDASVRDTTETEANEAKVQDVAKTKVGGSPGASKPFKGRKRRLPRGHIKSCLINIPRLRHLATTKEGSLPVYFIVSEAAVGYLPASRHDINRKRYISQELIMEAVPKVWRVPENDAENELIKRYNQGVKGYHNVRAADSVSSMLDFAESYVKGNKKELASERLELYILNIVAISTRGYISKNKLLKVNSQLSKHLDIPLEFNDIKLIFRDYEHTLKAKAVAGLLESLMSKLPDVARRVLRPIVEHSRYVGLTKYMFIVEAICTVEGFPWAEMFMLLPDDASDYRKTLGFIKDRPHFAYSRQFNQGSSSGYKCLAYAAWLALTKSGQTHLDNYVGFRKVPRASRLGIGAIVDGWVTKFKSRSEIPESARELAQAIVEETRSIFKEEDSTSGSEEDRSGVDGTEAPADQGGPAADTDDPPPMKGQMCKASMKKDADQV